MLINYKVNAFYFHALVDSMSLWIILIVIYSSHHMIITCWKISEPPKIEWWGQGICFGAKINHSMRTIEQLLGSINLIVLRIHPSFEILTPGLRGDWGKLFTDFQPITFLNVHAVIEAILQDSVTFYLVKILVFSTSSNISIHVKWRVIGLKCILFPCANGY